MRFVLRTRQRALCHIRKARWAKCELPPVRGTPVVLLSRTIPPDSWLSDALLVRVRRWAAPWTWLQNEQKPIQARQVVRLT